MWQRLCSAQCQVVMGRKDQRVISGCRGEMSHEGNHRVCCGYQGTGARRILRCASPLSFHYLVNASLPTQNLIRPCNTLERWTIAIPLIKESQVHKSYEGKGIRSQYRRLQVYRLMSRKEGRLRGLMRRGWQPFRNNFPQGREYMRQEAHGPWKTEIGLLVTSW